MTCLQAIYASGPCRECGAVQLNGAHIIDHEAKPGLYCAACCPIHNPKLKEWSAEPVTIAGEQGGLF